MSTIERNRIATICADLGIPFNRRVGEIVEQRDALYKWWSRAARAEGANVDDLLTVVERGLAGSALNADIDAAQDAVGRLRALLARFEEKA